VAPGTYYFYRALIWLGVYGLDKDDNAISQVMYPAMTCSGDSLAECAGQSYFARTVVAVPEPDTFAMLLAGLGLLAFITRRMKH
jgi:hypothetical protein